jgi:hypothetical protein
MRCDEVAALRDERRGDGTAGRTMGRADPEDPRYHNVGFKKSNTDPAKLTFRRTPRRVIMRAFEVIEVIND